MLYFRILIISSPALLLKTSTEAEFLMSFERLFQCFILEALKGKACCATEVRHWGWLSWLLCPIRVSFWAFYELWTLTFHSRLIQTQSSWQSAKAKKAALNLAKLWLTIKTWIKLQWKMYNNNFIRQQIWGWLKCFCKPWFLCTVFVCSFIIF